MGLLEKLLGKNNDDSHGQPSAPKQRKARRGRRGEQFQAYAPYANHLAFQQQLTNPYDNQRFFYQNNVHQYEPHQFSFSEAQTEHRNFDDVFSYDNRFQYHPGLQQHPQMPLNQAMPHQLGNGMPHQPVDFTANHSPHYSMPHSAHQPMNPAINYSGYPQSNHALGRPPSGTNQPVQSPYANPLLPQEQEYQQNPFAQFQQHMPPYPNGLGANQQKSPSTFGNIINQFKSQNGSLDVNKMVGTAGQMVSAVNQVSGLVKGLGGLFLK